MFLDNKYTKIYYQIIDKAKNRILEGYKERHHIIPRSLGGSNKKENLVSLTAREHFICHWLLVKMTMNDARFKMIYGFRMMSIKSSDQERYKTKITSKIYEKFKIEYGKIASFLAKNRPPVSDKTRQKLSDAIYKNRNINSPQSIEKRRQKRLGHEVSEKTREKIRNTLAETRKVRPVDNSFRKGVPLSEETKKKLSIINKGRKHSEETLTKLRGRKHSEETKNKMKKPKSAETKEKMRLASIRRETKKRENGYVVSEETRFKLKARLQEKRQCPHCGYIGNKPTISRLHMDKCRLKIIDINLK